MILLGVWGGTINIMLWLLVKKPNCPRTPTVHAQSNCVPTTLGWVAPSVISSWSSPILYNFLQWNQTITKHWKKIVRLKSRCLNCKCEKKCLYVTLKFSFSPVLGIFKCRIGSFKLMATLLYRVLKVLLQRIMRTKFYVVVILEIS